MSAPITISKLQPELGYPHCVYPGILGVYMQCIYEQVMRHCVAVEQITIAVSIPNRTEVKMESHEELLDTWATRPHHSKRGFVKDGIIDLSRWNSAPIKVLFLLKEAYSDPNNPSDWDLRVLLREEWRGPKYVIWWNTACWAYAAHHILDVVAPELPQSGQSYETTESLLSTAVVNVKKSSGKTNSDLEDIGKYAQLDGDLLKKQIDIINPDLVICGYTWKTVEHLWPSPRSLYDLVYEAEKKVFVDFWHPANQYPKKLNYYAITALLRHPNVRQTIQNHQNQQST